MAKMRLPDPKIGNIGKSPWIRSADTQAGASTVGISEYDLRDVSLDMTSPQDSTVGGTSPMRTLYCAPDSEYYVAAIEGLIGLFQEEDELIPNAGAFKAAWELLSSAHDELHSKFPKAKIVPDGQGGIEIYFNLPDRRVHLVVPGSGEVRPFIYATSENGPKTFPNATGSILAICLRWLTAK